MLTELSAFWSAALQGAAQPWVMALVLALTTLLLEDVAIAAGAALAAMGSLSWPLAFFAVAGGIAFGDLLLYAAGAWGQRWSLLRRHSLGERAQHMRARLVADLPSAVLLARVVPGLRLITYTACGLLRLPLWRFTAWVMLAVGVWTAGLFWFSAWLGQWIARALGWPVSVAVAAPILVLALLAALAKRLWRSAPQPAPPYRQHPTRPRPDPSSTPRPWLHMNSTTAHPSPLSHSPKPHEGMPPLDTSGRPLSYFEFWPMWAFYPPVFLYALWLMVRYRGVLLPTVANPSFPGGGFFGESKAEILNLAMRHIPQWVAPFVLRERPEAVINQPPRAAAAQEALAQAGLELPVVAKPDLGCRGAGVKLVRSPEQLQAYIAAFPAGARYLLQRYVPFEGEAGIFYCREPSQAQGRFCR